jgi:hypothetical protein
MRRHHYPLIAVAFLVLAVVRLLFGNGLLG